MSIIISLYEDIGSKLIPMIKDLHQQLTRLATMKRNPAIPKQPKNISLTQQSKLKFYNENSSLTASTETERTLGS